MRCTLGSCQLINCVQLSVSPETQIGGKHAGSHSLSDAGDQHSPADAWIRGAGGPVAATAAAAAVFDGCGFPVVAIRRPSCVAAADHHREPFTVFALRLLSFSADHWIARADC